MSIKQRLVRWLGLEHLQQDIENLRTDSIQLCRRHDRLRREVEEMGFLIRQTKDALGGHFWTTADGHTRPIALLSDTHLQAMLDGNFARGPVGDAVRAEQERRTSDDVWADRQGPGSLRVRVTRLEKNTVQFKPQPTPQQQRNLDRMDAKPRPVRYSRSGRVIPDEGPFGRSFDEPLSGRLFHEVDYSKLETIAFLQCLLAREQAKG